MTPVFWHFEIFTPKIHPVAAIYRGSVIVDFCDLGMWKRRIGWLPDWWPCNMRFDRGLESYGLAVSALHRWCAEQNAQETKAAAKGISVAELRKRERQPAESGPL